ncbi:hypothetical protein C1H46_020462 [Malus baccata]|uniref:Cation-transporting P-type ATPase C-terminal domain-containing protein n=1 Tax=Malus baccata TaxID=106549 RepID=A0A540M578_MALBA|nr:hypothetical protein C1H46_020462 [Malus baccata]
MGYYKLFGYNKLEEKKESKLPKFLGFMWNPLAWVMEAAALMSIGLAHGGVPRDGKWSEEDASVLVPDWVILFLLMLERLPVTKHSGDGVYSGSTCKQGEIEAVVIATGVHTLFGKAPILLKTQLMLGTFSRDKTGTLALNELTVDKNLIEVIILDPVIWVFAKGVEKDTIVLMATRASRLENKHAIDATIVAMQVDPEEILNLASNKSEIEKRVHTVIDKLAERGLRSLVAQQEVPAGTKDNPGGPWEFVGLLPLFDPPRHDSAETIRRALDLGIYAVSITIRIVKTFGIDQIFNENLYYPNNSLNPDMNAKLASAIYLQVSTISQALIFVTQSRGWSFMELPGLLLLSAFVIAQLTAFNTQKDFGKHPNEGLYMKLEKWWI